LVRVVGDLGDGWLCAPFQEVDLGNVVAALPDHHRLIAGVEVSEQLIKHFFNFKH
jgi:hypothetical protein